jgi:integrase/recombinase XerD
MSLVLPLNEWPSVDRDMWAALRSKGGPLDDCGGLAHVRETTITSLQPRYGRWLRWVEANAPEALVLDPVERTTLPRLQSWLRDMAGIRPMTRLAFVQGVVRILRAWDPDLDWDGHLRLIAALRREAGNGDPARKRGRILSSKVLLEMGLRHAGPFADEAATSLLQMLRHRDGTMVALLSLMQMRRRSFCELRLGHSVFLTEREIFISLSEEMTKTGTTWEAIVPPQVEPLLRRYIIEVRPKLISRGEQDHDILWVGKKGEMIGMNYVGKLVGDVTLEHAGKRIPPHFFRDAAATTLARVSPDAARLIRPVLAHSGFRTAERHYIHAKTIEAGRDYAALVKRLKGDQ